MRFAGLGKTAEGDDLGDDAAAGRGEGCRGRVDVDEGGGVVFWRFGFWVGRIGCFVRGRHECLVDGAADVEVCMVQIEKQEIGHAYIEVKTGQLLVSWFHGCLYTLIVLKIL